MRKSMLFAVAPMFAAVLAAGCQSAPQQPEPMRDLAVHQVEPVTIVDRAHGSDPALQQERVALIRTQDELAQLGAQSLQEMNVDLEQHDLVLVALGQQPTGGYAAEIESLQKVGDEIWVSGYARRPAEDAMTTQQLTYPYAVAVIPNAEPGVQLASDIQSVEGAPEQQGPAEAEPTTDEATTDEAD